MKYNQNCYILERNIKTQKERLRLVKGANTPYEDLLLVHIGTTFQYIDKNTGCIVCLANTLKELNDRVVKNNIIEKFKSFQQTKRYKEAKGTFKLLRALYEI